MDFPIFLIVGDENHPDREHRYVALVQTEAEADQAVVDADEAPSNRTASGGRKFWHRWIQFDGFGPIW